MTSFRVLTFDSLVSTNDEALGRLKAGDPGGLLVVARSQTGGRGRQGRAWSSPAGNLYATLALVDPSPLALAPQLGFVAGVALCDVLRTRLGGDPRLQIKWPNDIVFDGAKLAGILLESIALPGGQIGCVIGFGVNCASHPQGLPYRATDLATSGDREPNPETILAEVSRAIARHLASWDRGRGFAGIRELWLARAAGLGARIAIGTPSGERLAGIFRGLDASGRLRLGTADGPVTIDAGDVFLPGFATGAKEP